MYKTSVSGARIWRQPAAWFALGRVAVANSPCFRILAIFGFCLMNAMVSGRVTSSFGCRQPSRGQDAAEESALLFWTIDARHGGRGMKSAVLRLRGPSLKPAAARMASGTDQVARIVVTVCRLDAPQRSWPW